MTENLDPFIIAGRTFTSRLLTGTGKFSSMQIMQSCIEASGSEIVTVAMRRADLTKSDDGFLQAVDPQKYLFLPNTSGARTCEEAVRLARIAKAALGHGWVKLEITPEPRYLLPDPVETLRATEILVKEGHIILPYMNADPVLALRLQDAGAAAVMPLGAPIGSNRGIRTEDQIRIIIEQARVPVIVDAGLGAPSHASFAFEMGADAVLVNTALAVSRNPAEMGRAFALACTAGRKAFLAGLGKGSTAAEASSPLTGFLHT